MAQHMTSAELPAFIDTLPSIAEQRAIEQHNQPIIDALSIAVTQASHIFGSNSPEHQAACRVFDAAVARRHDRL